MAANATHAIVYIGSASYESPRTGLDNVIRTHIAELSQGICDVIAVIVSPTITQYTLFEEGKCRIHVYPNLFHSDASKMRILWEKARLALLTPHSVQSISLYSPAAARHAQAIIAEYKDSVIIADYIYCLTNIPMRVIFSGLRKTIYISHDIVTAEAFRSQLRYSAGAVRKALRLLQLAKSRWCVSRVIKHVNAAVFLSEYDRRLCQNLARKSFALLPFADITPDVGVKPQPHNNTVVFIGSPDFEPNAFAIRWLVECLSPYLMRLQSEIRIVLVGKDAANYIPADVQNVVAAGFVTGDAMHAMLRSAIALVCPIVHGGGVKIKILDAISQHCPVLATEEALRGYEYFQIAPQVYMDDPERTAEVIVELANQPELRTEKINSLAQSLRDYCKYRNGKLLAIADDLAQETL